MTGLISPYFLATADRKHPKTALKPNRLVVAMAAVLTVPFCQLSFGQSFVPSDQETDELPAQLYTPKQIEDRLNQALHDGVFDETIFDDVIVSRLGDNSNPIGFDDDTVIDLPEPDSQKTLGIGADGKPITQTGINPDVYIPKYHREQDYTTEVATHHVDEIKPDGLLKRLYDRVFNDGVSSVPRLDVSLFHSHGDINNTSIDNLTKIKRGDAKDEPYANIKAALEDITAESTADFRSAMPRLMQTAQAAARAVGYYDVKLRITKQEFGKINVIIDDIGEPVIVDHQILEVRGEGAGDRAYQEAVSSEVLKIGDTFHHGKYESNKSLIAEIGDERGYFDGRWLDSSADVILPDNAADVSLVYDTGEQYQFDDVVFFTIDPKTGQYTTDPDKLPVKAKLLEKLVNFQMGDAYNRQSVQNLSSDLLATGYFNTVNTETVFPGGDDAEGIDFEQGDGNDDQKPAEVDNSIVQTTQTIDLGDGITADVTPVEFSTSQIIQDKLALVTQKANRLYNAPEDRLLAINTQSKSKSILAKISDAVSNVARAILPDDDGEVDFSKQQPKLANKKTPQQVQQDKKVPLYVFVMADKPRDAQIGLGWGSDSGTRVVTKLEHNLINKDGYQAGVELGVSPHQKNATLYASRPLSHPLNDKLRAALSYEEKALNNGAKGFDLKTRTLEQSVSRNTIKENGWNRNYSLRYRLDELQTGIKGERIKDLPVKFADGRPTQEALLAGVSFSKNSMDDIANPMRGYRQQYSLELGSKHLMTDTDMAIVRAGINGMYSFGDNAYGKNRAHQVSGSLNAGYIVADDFNDVPYKLRFFAGGDQSIRGYNYESLSPISDKGYLTGGQALAVLSGEYNYEIMKGLRLGVFADVGNAYDKNFNNETKIGAGVGVRYASPVGQVRVDVATGIKEKDRSVKLHFFIGSPF
ncbi:BamA/TamA family outer membrane protein [Moraxella nasovis]|uniref:autotransporter assembly complex protein TamA n=1 Tax=Moraxella nasovis TaxID=2904121 RepID=UPI001F61B28C|nr:BamA/TamA family outer membrane protein [Moraxella nasovis]UNU73515.1 BamA/TamA family outer membrane protein [Moraxella nasovis]